MSEVWLKRLSSALAYVCEKSVQKPRAVISAVGRIILRNKIVPEQMRKLLVEGKTGSVARIYFSNVPVALSRPIWYEAKMVKQASSSKNAKPKAPAKANYQVSKSKEPDEGEVVAKKPTTRQEKTA